MNVLIFVLGGLLGIVLTIILIRSTSAGEIRFDTSDPEGPYLFLVMSKDINAIYKRKHILLKVNTKNFVAPSVGAPSKFTHK